jgi:class 3 adenylate cyclase
LAKCQFKGGPETVEPPWMANFAKFLKLRFDDERTERVYRLTQSQKNRRFLLGGILAVLPGVAYLFWLTLKGSSPEGGSHFGNYLGFGALLGSGGLFALLAATNTKFYQRHDDVIRAVLVFVGGVGSQSTFLTYYPTFYANIFQAELSIYVILIFVIMRMRRNVALWCGALYVLAVGTAYYLNLSRFPASAPSFQTFIGLTLPLTTAGVYIAHCFDKSSRDYFRIDQQLGDEMAKSRRLMLNILPEQVASRLQKDEGKVVADRFAEATVLFVDIVGFTRASLNSQPEATVARLNEIFQRFDGIIQGHGLEKIKTIGDSYMAVAGVPEPVRSHAAQAARAALEILEQVRSLTLQDGRPLRVRIGLHSGPLVAGVIGQTKFIYDVWGPTVNLASRMESTGEPDRIQMTTVTGDLLGSTFESEARGAVDCKGIGPVETRWLLRERQTLSKSA